MEFAQLVTKLGEHGVNAAAIARQLKMTPAAVSMIVNGSRSPRPLTLDALREFANHTFGVAESGEEGMRDGSVRSTEQIWRDRAIQAEQELANLKSAMRELLTTPPIVVDPTPTKFEEEQARATKKLFSKP